jgi:hypothetical protein
MSIEKKFYALGHKYDCKTAIQAQRAHKFNSFAFFRARYYGEKAQEATEDFLSRFSEGEVTMVENFNFHWAEKIEEGSRFFEKKAILTHEILNDLFSWVAKQLREKGETWSNEKYRIASLLGETGEQSIRVEIFWDEVKVSRNYGAPDEEVSRISMEKFVERFMETGRAEFPEIFA